MNPPKLRNVFVSVAFGIVGISSFAMSGSAQAETGSPVYAGKQIRLVIASGAGGAEDAYARILAVHLPDHIPGHPIIVPENMPGAAGLSAMNWTANAAPRDGTAIIAGINVILSAPLFGEAAARFDPRTFASLGSIGTLYNVCATWYTSSIKTIEQAKTRKVSVAAAGARSNSATVPDLLNYMLGTKFAPIVGYASKDMRLALERGEAEGVCGLGWSTLKASEPQWIQDHRLNILLQIGDKRQADLRDVPLLQELVSSESDKQILKVLGFPQEIGRPYFMPPGTSDGLVQIVRNGFDETMHDPGFLADARRAKLEVDPLSEAAMSKILADAYATPRALIEKAAPFSGVEVH